MWYRQESRPHVCPVCNGRGLVPGGFYDIDNLRITLVTKPEMCRTCGGTGIVWDRIYNEKCRVTFCFTDNNTEIYSQMESKGNEEENHQEA